MMSRTNSHMMGSEVVDLEQIQFIMSNQSEVTELMNDKQYNSFRSRENSLMLTVVQLTQIKFPNE